MVKGRRDPGLAIETVDVEPVGLTRIPLGPEVGDLQRHPAIEVRVVRQVNRPHCPPPQPLDDPVPAESLAQLDREPRGVIERRSRRFGTGTRPVGNLAEIDFGGRRGLRLGRLPLDIRSPGALLAPGLLVLAGLGSGR